MALYAVAISPMIKRLADSTPSCTQSWYADDDSVADKLRSLRGYWDDLSEIGPGYGYSPNPKEDHASDQTRASGGS